MSAGSRRKQNKPQKVDNPLPLTRNNGAGPTTICTASAGTNLDSHVCGQCCAQFFNLQDFIQHKSGCSGEWPAALGPKSASAAPSLSERSDEVSSDRLSSDDSAVDLTIKRADEKNNNDDGALTSKEVEMEDGGEADVSKLQTVLDSLQQQQIMQLKLIKRICSRVMPDSASTTIPDCLPSNFISPPDSNGTEDSAERDGNSQQLREEHICDICQEICCSRGALLWHTMHAHPSHRPFRCDICSQRFSHRLKIRAHIEQHKYSNWLQRSRARSSSPLDFFRRPSGEEETSGGRRSVPPLNDDSEEALTSVVSDKSQSDTDDSPSNPDPDDITSYSDISQASTPTQQTERPLDLSFGEINALRNGAHNFLLPNRTDEHHKFENNGPGFPGGMGGGGNRCFGLLGGGSFPSAPLAVPTIPGANGGGSMYSPVKDDDDWESMMEVCQTDEAEKIRQLVGDQGLFPQPPVTDPNQCLICRRILSCKSALQMHYRTHTGQRPFKCKICLRAFTTKGNLKTHMAEVTCVSSLKHPFRMHHQCPICQKRFLNAVLLQQHIRLHTTQLRSAPPNPPPVLPPDHASHHPPPTPRSAVAPPQEVKPQPPAPPLQVSSMSLMSPTSSFSLSSGLRLPLVPQPYPFTPVMLPVSQQQLSMMTGRPGTTCNICYKVFACNSALEIHYRSHTKERPFKCDACGRGFSTKGNMKQHLLTHKIRDMPQRTDSRSDTQSTTPSETESKLGGAGMMSFQQQSETSSSAARISEESSGIPVKRDSSLVENVKKEVPDEAEETLRSYERSELSRSEEASGSVEAEDPSPLESIQRMWAQTEPPPPRKPPILSKHQCGVCFKHFSSSSALQIHMRTHTGDKPFKCTVCSRAFTTKGNLKVHMGTHMWQNPSRRGRRIFDLPGSPGSQRLLGEYPRSPINGDSSRDGDNSSPPLLENEARPDGHHRPETPPDTSIQPGPGRDVHRNGGGASIQKILSSGFPPLFPSVSFPTSLPSVSLPIPSPFLSGRKSFTGPDAAFSCSGAANNFGPLYPPPHAPPGVSRFQDSSPGISGFGRGDSMETMMWMWRNVCSVCQRICSSPAELEEHLKLHLNGSRSAAAV